MNGIIQSFMVLAVLTALLGIQPPAASLAAPLVEEPARPLLLPAASVTLGMPGTVTIGEAFSFTATFDNTDADEVGYGPFIDLVFPVIGADGAGAAVDDGITFVSATLLGAPVTSVVQTFGTANTGGCAGGLGPVNHPYAIDATNTPLVVCGTPGNALVTLQLPFGSFAPDQPAAVVTVNAQLSNLADVNTALTLRSRGGYQYGATPTNDWCCGDVSIVSHGSTSSGWPGSPVTPAVFTLAKAYNGPEDETATGPNFPREYTLTVDVATGQPVTALTINDTLPNNMQFVGVVSTVPAATCSTPGTSTPGGSLSCNFGSVTGAAGTDATLVFEFYIPLNNSSSAPVINASTGDDAASQNTSTASASWDPIDSRDPVTPVTAGGVCPTGCHDLTDKSIAIQKGVLNILDTGYAGNSPGDTLEYTLDIQVSDFFSLEGLVVTDIFSDGQHLDLSFTPTLQVNGNGYTLAAAAMNAANYDEIRHWTGGPGVPVIDGTTEMVFRLSDELVTRGESGALTGGCVPPGGTGGPVPNCDTGAGGYDDGGTTATIVFHTVIQDEFTDDFPSGDESVDHGDILENDVTVTGDLLSVADNATPTGSLEADTSGTELSIAFGTLGKDVFAVNGVDCSATSCATEISTNGLNPGDTITFRLEYFQPSSDFEQTILTDYLPLPVFEAATVTTFSNAICGIPASGNACLGPGDTYHALNGAPTFEPNPVVTPVMSVDAVNNAVQFSYADYDSATNTSSNIDILFTVTVSDEPFADGLFLTNQANASEGTTNAGDQALDTILQILINEPFLVTSKSAVSTDSTSTNVTFAPAIGAPIVFDTPGVVDGPADWTGGTISSNYLDANNIDADLTGIDAGDLVKFAIVIENQGNSLEGAFDVTIQDIMPAEYIIPGSGLNFEVFFGDGTAVPYTDLGGGIFGSGIQLIDPGASQGACQAHHATNGLNVIIITYDLELSGAVSLSQNIINTSTITNYASTEGGPNFVPSGESDTATVTPIATPVKDLVSTSEAHTEDTSAGTTADPRRVAIGEIVRYRLTVAIAEGMVPNFRLRDNIPTGLTFLNDSTARVALVSNSGLSSSTLSGAGLSVVGDETNVDTITPTFALPDDAVSTTDSTLVANYGTNNADAYVSGTDVYFKLGDLTNPDRDNDNGEFVVVEFNAIVANVAANGTGNSRDNTAIYRVGSSTTNSATSNTIRVRTTQPSITMAKSILSQPAVLDAGGQVTYRIVIANGSGADVTTAFDLVLTDTLPNALTLNALPGSVSVATTGTVGTMTNFSAVNTPPGTPSVMEVHIESMAAGSSVTVDYTSTINGSITPGQIITNTGNLEFTSLPGTNGTTSNPTGSSTPGASGADNGERNGDDGPTGSPDNYARVDTESFTGATLDITKQLIATSAVHTSGSDVAIGEIVTYGILLTFPEGTTAADTVLDDLPSGLALVSGSPQVITLAAASGGLLTEDFSGTIGAQNIVETAGDGGAVQFDFTNVTVPGEDDLTESGDNTLLMVFQAQVTNILANQAGTVISNEATNTAGTQTDTTNTVDVIVVEPVITFSKSIVELPSPPDAGGVVHYQISFANAPGAMTAMDVHITDALAAELLLPSTGAPDLVITPSAGVTGITNSSTASNIDITIASVPPGESVIVDFYPVIQGSITPGQVIDNVGDSTWTSLSGTVTGERDGSDGPSGSPDDYAATDNVSFSSTNVIGITKQLISTSAAHTSGSDVAIGEIVTYTILLTFPEGATPSDTVVDDLPSGLALVPGSPAVIVTTGASGSVLTANFNGAIGSLNVVETAGDGGAVQFDLTNVTVSGDNDVTNNTIQLNFQAQVTDILANQAGTVISNQAANTLGTGAPTGSNIVDVTVVEPVITFSKTIVSLPTPLDAGGVVHYQISFANTAGSTAMDVNITDALAAELLLPSTGAPDLVITPSAGVGAITNNSTASTIDITIASVPAGENVIVDFYPVIQGSITPGQVIDNVGNSTWTSLSGAVAGERTGAGGVDDYTATDNESFGLISDPFFSKTIDTSSADHTSEPDLAIGEVVTFGLLVTLPEGTTPALTVVDQLPFGLSYVDASYVVVTQTNPPAVCGTLAADFNGTLPAPTVTVNPPAGGNAAEITFDFGSTTVTGDNVTTNNSFLICFEAILLNDAANQNGDDLTNDATLTVGAEDFTDSEDVNVVEPVLVIAKSANELYPVAGEVVTFTLTVNHDGTSTADAFDAVIVDDLPAAFTLNVGSIAVTPAGGVSGITTANSTGNHLEVGVDEFPLGGTLQITFEATYTGALGTSADNVGVVTWTSLPGADANERNGSDGEGGALNDYEDTSAIVGVQNLRELEKSLVSTDLTSNETLPNVTIGDILTYQVEVTVPPSSTDTILVVDTLDSGLAFVDCSDITAGTGVTSSTVALNTNGNCNPGTVSGTNNPLIANSGALVTFDLGTVTNSDTETRIITLTYTVAVLDVVANNDGDAGAGATTLDNDVEITWTTSGGGAGTLSASAAPVTVNEPNLTLLKTVDPLAGYPGDTITYTLRVEHAADTTGDAFDLVLTDVLPAGLEFSGGDPTVTTASGQAPDVILYIASTRTLTLEWTEFQVGAFSELEIEAQIALTVGRGAEILNEASLEWSSLPGDISAPQSVFNTASTERRYDPLSPADVYIVSSEAVFTIPRLPRTGFAPGRVTLLPPQPAGLQYTDLGDFWIEIPKLDEQLSIVGVPLNAQGWDLTWLGDQAGYLAGTAYPTHAGNSGITAHAYLPNGEPGPFVNLNKLSYGDRILVHLDGEVYTYEVRENRRVNPDDLTALKHEEYPWLTLITCQEYSEILGDYRYRIAVRAVLIEITPGE